MFASKVNDGLIDDRMFGRFEFGPAGPKVGFYTGELLAFLVRFPLS